MYYNYKRYLKQFIQLFASIYKYKVDNIILSQSNLCLPHKNKIVRVQFSNLQSFFPYKTRF